MDVMVWMHLKLHKSLDIYGYLSTCEVKKSVKLHSGVLTLVLGFLINKLQAIELVHRLVYWSISGSIGGISNTIIGIRKTVVRICTSK